MTTNADRTYLQIVQEACRKLRLDATNTIVKTAAYDGINEIIEALVLGKEHIFLRQAAPESITLVESTRTYSLEADSSQILTVYRQSSSTASPEPLTLKTDLDIIADEDRIDEEGGYTDITFFYFPEKEKLGLWKVPNSSAAGSYIYYIMTLNFTRAVVTTSDSTTCIVLGKYTSYIVAALTAWLGRWSSPNNHNLNDRLELFANEIKTAVGIDELLYSDLQMPHRSL